MTPLGPAVSATAQPKTTPATTKPATPARKFALTATRAGRTVLGLVTVIVLLALWQLLVSTKVISFTFLPGPAPILRRLVELAPRSQLWDPTTHTVQLLLLTWITACAVGIVLGLLYGLSRVTRLFCSTSIEILRPLPAVGFIPVAVVIFGLSDQVEYVTAAFAGVWPVLVNTAGATRGVDSTLRNVGTVLGLSRMRAARTVLLPAVVPAVITGARISLGVVLAVLTAVEMTGIPQGLGYAIVFAQQADAPNDMFAYIATIGAVGLIADFLLSRLARALLPGHRPRLGSA